MLQWSLVGKLGMILVKICETHHRGIVQRQSTLETSQEGVGQPAVISSLMLRSIIHVCVISVRIGIISFQLNPITGTNLPYSWEF